LLVGVSNFPEASGSAVSGVTINGSSAGIDRLDGSGTDMYVLETVNDAEASIYKKVAPASGTNTVEVTFAPDFTNAGAVAGALCLSGVDQTNPLGNWNSNKGATASPAGVTVSSATGELVFSVAAMEKATSLSSDGDTDHWVRFITPTNDNSAGGGATKAGAGSVTVTWSWPDAADHWAMGTFLPGGGVDPLLNSTTTMNTDTWYHAAVNVRQDTDTIRLFLNGTQEDVNSAWTGAIGNGTYDFNLGRRPDVSQWFDGYMDEVRVTSTHRGSGWIETSYNNQNSTTAFYSVASQEAYESVDITVYVHNTKTDGTDAQLIVFASTTIDKNTADPLAIDLGNDAIGQTYTSADPRVIRVQVEVTGINAAGSFVLDYDGPCASNACSSLDTPAVVVPEFALIFGAFVLLIPVAMGSVWRRRRRDATRANAKDADAARLAHDPLAHSQRRAEPSRSLASVIDQRKTP
jgi:hypothetical protein